jgi:peptide/nickel transport system substrate-binding protein
MFLPAVFSAGGPVQPPVDTTTLYSTTIAWGPRYADPVRAYDSASFELLSNVYENLVAMGSIETNNYGSWDTFEQYWAFNERISVCPNLAGTIPSRQEDIWVIPDTGINPVNPTSYWTLTPRGYIHIEGWIDDNPDGQLGSCDIIYVGYYLAPMRAIQEAIAVYTWHVISFTPGWGIEIHHYYYDFNMRNDLIPFVDTTGAVVDYFDITDAQYSLQRGLVQDQIGGPTWMLYKPLLGQMNSNWLGNGGMDAVTASWCMSWLINGAIEIMPENVLRINVGIPFPDGAFKQILAHSGASILSKSWCIGKGCWNGYLFEDTLPMDGVLDWYVTWRHIASPIQTVSPDNYAGTGPYRVTTADSTIEGGLVVLEWNTNYWHGWPREGQKSFLQKVQIDYVSDWTTRKGMFIDGKSDVTSVPRSNMFELLDQFGDPIYPEMKTIKAIVPVLAMTSVLYTGIVDTSVHDFLYTGEFPTGAPTDLMNNVHVRNAFTYAFNRTKYIQEAWYSEGICRETPAILGLIPDYYTKGDGSVSSPWKFNYDLAAMEAELKLAMFTQGATTQSVWDWGGFHIDIVSSGNALACENIKAGFDALNAASGKYFQVTVQSLDWATYLECMEESSMPVWIMGWVADFADADNWYRPFMHTYGDLSFYQHYNSTATVGPRTGLNKDQLIDLAAKTPDGFNRADMYADLDDIFLTDNPGFPIIQAQGRRWCKYWVKGWYYNALSQSQYYYRLYKDDTCWANVNGPTAGVPDAKTDMRDVSYVAGHFGAKAPNPGAILPMPIYDPKWAPGTYGNGGCDLVGDRKVDMRDIAFAAAHFLHEAVP